MSILELKSGTMYEYGCLMLYVSIPNWSELTKDINLEDLFQPDNERYGIETEPHITILYGIHSDVPDDRVFNLFEDIDKSDFDIEVTSKNCFFNKDYDVLKLDITSKKLNQLNELGKTLPHTDTYPTYKPHMTIAYLKKGEGSKYVDETYSLKINKIDKIVYSKPNGEKIDILLNQGI
jgi:2'-5' RNA ligase